MPERCLIRAFAAAKSIRPVLLFDEADALFGKRTGVRDSHDRYSDDDGKRRATPRIGRSYRQFTDATIVFEPLAESPVNQRQRSALDYLKTFYGAEVLASDDVF